MNDPFGSGLEEGRIRSKPYSISGTTQRASFIRFVPTTAISTSFDNRHRRRMGRGIWFHFARCDKSVRHGKLAAPGDPHLPSIERKIQNADEYACRRQNGCGDVGIDQLVQVVEQKPTLVRLDSGFAFEPVL